jgi:hypothetical protein
MALSRAVPIAAGAARCADRCADRAVGRALCRSRRAPRASMTAGALAVQALELSRANGRIQPRESAASSKFPH